MTRNFDVILPIKIFVLKLKYLNLHEKQYFSKKKKKLTPEEIAAIEAERLEKEEERKKAEAIKAEERKKAEAIQEEKRKEKSIKF